MLFRLDSDPHESVCEQKVQEIFFRNAVLIFDEKCTKVLLQEIRTEYDRLDKLLGVDTSGVEIVISPHRGKRLGSFRSPGEGVPPMFAKSLRISISAAVMENDDAFWDTIRHKYAHAVVYLPHPGENHGHDAAWKAVCRKIGCTPKGTTAASDEQK